MLQPANRLTLLDAMRPPAGYEFEQAMAVTFTLDLRALLVAPAAFALAGGAVETDPSIEPIELLHAIRSHAQNITIFSQAGEIAVPPTRRVFAFLEGTVVPVTAPLGGIVHPKIWVLRYVAPGRERPHRLRVLAASRNLTFDTSWDTVLRLDSTDGTDGVGADVATLEPIADLFDALPTLTVATLEPVRAARVAALSDDVRSARFAIPLGLDGVRAHVLGLTSASSPLPTTADRSMVIAPFVTDAFLTAKGQPPINVLVSRQEALDQLTAKARARAGEVFVFDDGGTPDVAPDPGLAPRDPAQPLRGLHAKVFAFEAGGAAQLFCGSANATGAAFATNVEVLFELAGPVGAIGIDALLAGTGDELGLRALLQPYVPGDPPPTEDPSTALDASRYRLGRLDVTGTVERSGEGWRVTYRSPGPLPHEPGVVLTCWPLSAKGNQKVVPGGRPLDVAFEVSLETISGFVVFEAGGADGTVTHCIVPARLNGVPEDRDRHLMRSLVGSADRFLRYLLLLLADGRDDLDLLALLERDAEGPDGDDGSASGLGLPVLERLLHSLRTDPGKLVAIDPLVRDLAADGALPAGFETLWQQLGPTAVRRLQRHG